MKSSEKTPDKIELKVKKDRTDNLSCLQDV